MTPSPLSRLMDWILAEPKPGAVNDAERPTVAEIFNEAARRLGDIDQPPLIDIPVTREDIEHAQLMLSDATREDGRRIYLTYAERDRLARLIKRLWEEAPPWPRENL